MQIEILRLWDDPDNVAELVTYRLADSDEFLTGRRRPAVIICPGGGYLGTSDREAEPVALRFAAQGYHAFVLRYNTRFGRLPEVGNPACLNWRSVWPQPLWDLGRAMRCLHRHARDWCVDTQQILVCGFSAGGHLAASLGTNWQDPALQTAVQASAEQLRPAALVLGYAVLDYQLMADWMMTQDEARQTECRWYNQALFGQDRPTEAQLQTTSPLRQVTALMPPTFLWHTATDATVPASNSLQFALALARHQVPYELHLYAEGPHGLSLADQTTAHHPEFNCEACRGWFDLMLSWLRRLTY